METKSPTVLLAEDDESVAEPLVFGLKAEGFRVLHAIDGAQALEVAGTERPDVILLDVMMPEVDGFTVCRTLRQRSSVPIIMLTARGDEMDRVMGLELGADDYLAKPFSFRELLARIRAVLRRRSLDAELRNRPSGRLEAKGLVLDRSARLLWQRERPVDLRQREFDLLGTLMEHAGTALSRHQLLNAVWGECWIGDPHTLDVHIRWLREKIEDDPSHPQFIQTVRGFGYRFVDPDSSPAASK